MKRSGLRFRKKQFKLKDMKDGNIKGKQKQGRQLKFHQQKYLLIQEILNEDLKFPQLPKV